MAISFTNLTVNGSITVTNSYSTASVSPTANRLILVTVVCSHSTAAETPTISGASMTWELVRSKLRSNNTARISVFRSQSSSPGSGALTISFSTNHNNCTWAVDQSGSDIAVGGNGSYAIIQSADNETSATNSGLTVNLGAFSSALNGTFGCVRVGGNPAVTPGSGFNEIIENNVTGATLQTQYKTANDTSVDWSWSGVGAISMGIALEINPTSPQSGGGAMFFGGGVTIA